MKKKKEREREKNMMNDGRRENLLGEARGKIKTLVVRNNTEYTVSEKTH